MFIVPPSKRAVVRRTPVLRDEVKAYKRFREGRTINFRVSADVIAALGWDDVSRVRLRIGAGEDAGRILLLPDAADGPEVSVTRPKIARASAIVVHSSFIGRLAPAETITVPHSLRAAPGTDRNALELDVSALPSWEETRHAA